MTICATFGYDGMKAWAESSGASHTTYNGWSYGGETIMASGGTVSLRATLSKFPHTSIAVDVSLTCSPTGAVS